MPERTGPQYDYSHGLHVDRTVRRGGHVIQHAIHLPAAELALPQSDARREVYERVDALVADPQIEKTRSGHAIEFVVLNQDSPDNGLEVVHLEWHTAVRDPGVRPLLAALALSGRRRMVVSSFGMGQASPLPRRIAQEMARSGSFVPAAEHLASAYQRVIGDYDRLVLSGTSEGARRAIGLAAIFEHVHSLFSHDGPGSRQMEHGWIGTGRAFLSEQEHNKAYTAAAQDPELQTAQRAQDGLRRFGRSVLRQLAIGNVINLTVREPAAMGHPMLGTDVATALPHIHHRVAFSVPEFSRLNNPGDVLAMADHVGTLAGEDGPEIVTLAFPGSHSSGAANMPVVARLYDLAQEAEPTL